jgi:outer membrane protein assembly factor BamB
MRRVGFRAALGLSVAFLVGGAAVAPPAVAADKTDWKQFGYSATHSGYAPFETALSVANVAGLKLQWARQLPQQISGTPAVAESRVFAAGYDNQLYALARRDGHRLWTVTSPSGLYMLTPAVSGDVVIVGGGTAFTGLTAAYDVRTGKLRWQTDFTHAVRMASPTVYQDKVFVGTLVTLHALSAANGKELWSTVLTDTPNVEIGGPVAVSDGGALVVSTTTDGRVTAVDAATGQIRWSMQLGVAYPTGGPAISAGIGYVVEHTEWTAAGFKLFAFQVSSGRILWSRPCAEVNVTPTVGRGSVYVGSHGGGLDSFDARTGAPRWAVNVGATVRSQGSLANGVLYVVTDLGLSARNAATGEELYRDDFGAPLYPSAPAISSGRVFMGIANGVMVYGLK